MSEPTIVSSKKPREHSVLNNLNYKLQEFHGHLLRIEQKTQYIKGKTNIIIEFTDPCDRVSKLAFYENHDPFALHDFEKEIPNPNQGTCSK